MVFFRAFQDGAQRLGVACGGFAFYRCALPFVTHKKGKLHAPGLYIKTHFHTEFYVFYTHFPPDFWCKDTHFP